MIKLHAASERAEHNRRYEDQGEGPRRPRRATLPNEEVGHSYAKAVEEDRTDARTDSLRDIVRGVALDDIGDEIVVRGLEEARSKPTRKKEADALPPAAGTLGARHAQTLDGGRTP